MKLKKTKSDSPILNDKIQEALILFLEKHSPKRVSKSLRKMLIEYLMYEGSIELPHLQEMLADLDGIFELLDAVDTEWQSVKN